MIHLVSNINKLKPRMILLLKYLGTYKWEQNFLSSQPLKYSWLLLYDTFPH